MVVGDMLFNLIVPPKDVIGRIICGLFGSVGPLKVTRLGKFTILSDKSIARSSLLQLANSYDEEGKNIT